MRAARIRRLKVILYEPNVFGIGPWRREAFESPADPGRGCLSAATARGVPEVEAALREWMARGDRPAA